MGQSASVQLSRLLRKASKYVFWDNSETHTVTLGYAFTWGAVPNDDEAGKYLKDVSELVERVYSDYGRLTAYQENVLHH